MKKRAQRRAIMDFRHLRGYMDQNRREIEDRHSAEAFLDFMDGRTIPVSGVATIGRAPDSLVVLIDRSVSRHHARIFYESGHFWLKDLDSANGTTLNRKRVKNVQMLRDEDEIAFGEIKTIFRASDQPGPASIGNDPLEGEEPLSQDGTPTDNLGLTAGTTAEYINSQQMKNSLAGAQRQLKAKKEESELLKREVAALRSENTLLRRKLEQKQGTGSSMPAGASIPAASGTLEQENQRLIKLTKQLEKALADVNLRLRNLQRMHDRESD